MSMVTTIAGFGRPRPRMLEPRPVGWEGRLSGSGSTLEVGDEKQRPLPRLSCVTPSPSQRRR